VRVKYLGEEKSQRSLKYLDVFNRRSSLVKKGVKLGGEEDAHEAGGVIRASKGRQVTSPSGKEFKEGRRIRKVFRLREAGALNSLFSEREKKQKVMRGK